MTATLLERAAHHEAGHCLAAITFAIPIISVTIDDDVPHMHRGRYRPPHDCGLECMVTLCLAGPAAEQYFCGPITDGSDQIDRAMARDYLAGRFDPLWIGVEMARLGDAAERLVKSAWGQQRIRQIAEALLDRGTLSGSDIGW